MSTGGTFEALNYALRKSKDGVIVSFVVHPSDVDSALTALPIGARVEIKWRELNEEQEAGEATADEPVAGCGVRDDVPHVATAGAVEFRAPATNKQPLSLSSQCALRCKDKRFWEWLSNSGRYCMNEGQAVDWVYNVLYIKSRSELDKDEGAAARWRTVESDFQSHLTSQMHAGSYR